MDRRDFLRSQVNDQAGIRLLGLSATLLIFGIGLADYTTGYHLSVGLFYVAPVSLLSWYGSRRAGVIGSAFSALTWLLANLYSAPPEIARSIILWNTMIRFGFFVIIAFLLASLRASHVREKELARTDPLTGLANGRAFRERAELELLRSRRVEQPLTLLYLDLNHFKTLNDRLGHPAGDLVLTEFAQVLLAAVRVTDVVCRLGGDEFVVLLPDTSDTQGQLVVSKIHQAVSGDPRLARHGLSVSIGSATTTEVPTTIDDLVTAADSAMYSAKRS